MAKIVQIITGSIRAERGLEIAVGLRRQGHTVRLLVTRAGWLFLLAHFFRHPSAVPAFVRMWHSTARELLGYLGIGSSLHVGLSRWADTVIVAPCTCNTLASIASGGSSSFPLLVVRALDLGKPVWLATAMNPQMWEDPANQRNFEFLSRTEKYRFVGPVEGVATSGDTGKVMAPADMIIAAIAERLAARPPPV